MVFSYEKDTKHHYQSNCVAEKYYANYALEKGWRSLRFRTVAHRERELISRYMRKVPHASILDIPAGTGKLALIFKDAGSWVQECDISENMLSIARKEFQSIEYDNVEFQVCDAERINETINKHFDLAICLRLLHRVPTGTKYNILKQLATSADYAIVSVGVESSYHKYRRSIRNALFKGGTDALCYESKGEMRKIIEKHFEIIECSWLIPAVSQEMIYLLRSLSNRS
jgi:SAM-dependent methyltransferase